MTISLVTGTSTGIGLATAVRLAQDGHSVYASMRDPEKAGPLRAAAEQAGVALEVVALDVVDDRSVRDAVGAILEREGRIDNLVNNAGIDEGDCLEETPLETFHAVMETNFHGAIRCIQAVLPGMRARRSGCIVNVSSLTGRVPSSGASAYCASKAALESASECLAAEVSSFDVRVALIEPGLVLTPIFAKRRLPSADSPYADLYRRNLALFPKLIESGSTAEDTAEVIARAIRTETPQLRYLVGWDAKTIVDHRARMTDEEFVAMGRCDSDEDFYTTFEKHFGIDVRRVSE
ncbi:MAG: SDR family oxidoreductase [Deltaproteobacteria bacterium]|nr:SDR family oxidoreductase [Deltaproteobacteria bacterium]